MTRELYAAIVTALESIKENGEQLVKHIDLWNQNVEFIEQESPWLRPAVFVEFGTVQWKPLKSSVMTGELIMTLHIVTDYSGEREQLLKTFDILRMTAQALAGIRGDGFHRCLLLDESVNHNHEDLVETMQRYRIAVDITL